LSCSWNQLPANGNAAFTIGLIRDVKLLVSPLVSIGDVFVYTRKLNPDGSATLAISGTVRNDGAAEVRRALDLELRPANFSGAVRRLAAETLSLRPGANEFSLESVVKDPKLWWTWDLGTPNLYTLVATLAGSGGGAEDRHETVVGIRTVARGPDMSYRLNGQHLFGTRWETIISRKTRARAMKPIFSCFARPTPITSSVTPSWRSRIFTSSAMNWA
jgi:hypothetical protein